MQYKYFLVKTGGLDASFHNRPERNPVAVTMFAFVENPPTHMSLPSGKDGLLDTLHYDFIPLTEAEYRTYIEFDMFPDKDSDCFVLSTADEYQQ